MQDTSFVAAFDCMLQPPSGGLHAYLNTYHLTAACYRIPPVLGPMKSAVRSEHFKLFGLRTFMHGAKVGITWILPMDIWFMRALVRTFRFSGDRTIHTTVRVQNVISSSQTSTGEGKKREKATWNIDVSISGNTIDQRYNLQTWAGTSGRHAAPRPVTWA